MSTTIHSNGPKWLGQEPDTIDTLINTLENHAIEKRFFTDGLHPIRKLDDGSYYFFGNFERLSHVFRIETSDPEVIKKLKSAIQNNEGTKKYSAV